MPISQDNRHLILRLKWLQRTSWFLFLVLLIKLWHLSVVQYESHSRLAQRNQIRTIPLLAPRGIVYDREGRVLVDNVQGISLVLYRDEISDLSKTIGFLVGGLKMTPSAIEERLRIAQGYAAYQPLIVREDLSIEEIAYVLSHQAEHPELGIIRQPKRSYRHGTLGAHFLGYVGEISKAQLEQPEYEGFRPGDIIGKFGVERAYNRRLTGQDGYRKVLVNSLGKIAEELETVWATEGRELRLTVDLDLQLIAEAELGEDPGAVVALKPQAGEILAMASSPGFDPNRFAGRISRREWEELTGNPEHPMQNRAIQASFSPGSIFKIVVALAGLERGLIDENTIFHCGGGATFYGHYFRCWKEGGHGALTVVPAIRLSCNVFFYHLGQRLGISQLAAFSQAVGLGQLTGVDLFGEATGLVPSEEWKRRALGQRWHAGETISVSIGQGPMNVTPLQMARAVGVIATGKAPQPTLVPSEVARPSVLQTRLEDPVFLPDHLRLIRRGMWQVVNDWGTGRGARVDGFEVCGKTGTAQTISRQARARLSPEDAKAFEANAWFVGFAPRENPEIVVAVIVQRGGSGGSVAAPIAGKILRRYHEKMKSRLPAIFDVALESPDLPDENTPDEAENPEEI